MNRSDPPIVYEILFRGHLDQRRVRWFEGLEIKQLPDGSSYLTGQLSDQAALYGILNRLRDLGLELLSVRKL